MKWTSHLRRWTMRGIHAAILGSAMLGTARVAVAQTTTNTANKLPDLHYSKSQSFDLPIRMDQDFRATLSEIRLYVKTPTTEWKIHEIGAPGLERFNCRVTEDGEYWYSLATVDKMGRMSPASVNLEGPSQRVMVDTTAPVIQVQPWHSPSGDFCLRCTVQDVNPDLATLKAVCRTDSGDLVLPMVPDQVGVFLVKAPEAMKFPVVISVMDRAKNVGTKVVNVKELVTLTLNTPPKGPPDITQIGGNPERKVVPPPMQLDPPPRGDFPPRIEVPPPVKNEAPPPVKNELPPLVKNELPPPPPVDTLPGAGNPMDPPKVPTPPVVAPVPTPTPPVVAPNPTGIPHQLINTTHASLEYRIDQVGPSGVGKVEIFMTHDKGESWHRLGEDPDKRSPADINLPGDGVYGIRVVVTNGNGFGGKAPVRGDAPNCYIEVDTTTPFVQLRSTEVLPSSGQVELRWNATDKNLGTEPVSLFYRTTPDGQWKEIARGLKNELMHRWTFPRDAGAQFFFKIEVTDLAGNMSQDVSRQPVTIDTSEPRATVVGVTGSGTVRPK